MLSIKVRRLKRSLIDRIEVVRGGGTYRDIIRRSEYLPTDMVANVGGYDDESITFMIDCLCKRLVTITIGRNPIWSDPRDAPQQPSAVCDCGRRYVAQIHVTMIDEESGDHDQPETEMEVAHG
jgi:hypothetical protein